MHEYHHQHFSLGCDRLGTEFNTQSRNRSGGLWDRGDLAGVTVSRTAGGAL